MSLLSRIAIAVFLVLVFPAVGTAQCTSALGDSLIGFYALTNATDSSVISPINNGTASGVIFAEGVVGDAAYFDGASTYIELDTNFTMDTVWSFSAWIKPDSYHNGSIFSTRAQCTSAGNGWNKYNVILINPNPVNVQPLGTQLPGISVPNQLSINLERAESCGFWGNSYGYTVEGVTIDTTCWTHIVLTCTNSFNTSRTYDAYINGVKHDVTLYKIPNANNLNNSISPYHPNVPNMATYVSYIGRNSTLPAKSFHFDGGIDHVKIYKRVLDSCEAVALYHEGLDTAIVAVQSVGDTTLCPGDQRLLSLSSTDTINYYHWYVNDSLWSTNDTFLFVPATDSTQHVQLAISYGLYCIPDTIDLYYTIDSVVSITDSISICSGDSIFLGGVWQFGSGTFTDTIQSISSCDTIATVVLTVGTISTTLQDTACSSYTVPSGTATYTASGTYSDTLTAAAGCDSVLIIELVINQPNTTSDTVAICPGDSALIGGVFHSVAGIYADTLTNAVGCDSIAVTLLVVQTTSALLDTVVICLGDSALIQGAMQMASGFFADTLAAANGCDSIVGTILLVDSFPQFDEWKDTTACGPVVELSSPLPTTTVLWPDGSSLPVFQVTESGLVWVTVVDDALEACPTSDTLMVALEACDDTPVLIVPNVMTPNGDGVNDVFRVESSNVTAIEVAIYNRWGALVAELSGVNASWTGRTFSGNPVSDGVYYVLLIATGSNEEALRYQGTLTVMQNAR